MRYPTFLSLIIKFPIQMAQLGVFSMDQLRGKCPCFLSSIPCIPSYIPLKSQRFWRLKHLQPQRFPHSAKPHLASAKGGTFFLAWPIPKPQGLSHSIPILQNPILVGEVPIPRNHGTRWCMTWLPKLQSHQGLPSWPLGSHWTSRHQLVHWRDTPCWIVLHCPLAHPVRNPVLKEWCFLSKIGKT